MENAVLGRTRNTQSPSKLIPLPNQRQSHESVKKVAKKDAKLENCKNRWWVVKTIAKPILNVVIFHSILQQTNVQCTKRMLIMGTLEDIIRDLNIAVHYCSIQELNYKLT